MAGQNPRYIPGYLDTQTGQFVQQIPQQQQQQQQSSNRIPSNQIMAGGRNNGQFAQYGQPIQQPVNYNFPVADNMMPPYAPTQQVPSAVRYEYMPNSRGEFVPVRTYNYNAQYSSYPGSGAPVRAGVDPDGRPYINNITASVTAPVTAPAPIAITQSGKLPAITQTAKQAVANLTPQQKSAIEQAELNIITPEEQDAINQIYNTVNQPPLSESKNTTTNVTTTPSLEEIGESWRNASDTQKLLWLLEKLGLRKSGQVENTNWMDAP